uniref:Cadherin domain-containing protein n=1 Tax=Octopus bimaculoides TaxID=37653 RepID=A0A0L8H8R3_OCTBM
MLSVILLMLLIADSCWCVDHIYHVKENNDIHSYIGDIVTDTHLVDNIQSQGDNNKPTFKILQGGTDGTVQLFNVTSGGQLYTAAILDAETLCQYNVECFRILEIAVQYDHSFIKILEIKVMIEDVNDNYPIFPSKQFHLQFDENDLKGTKEILPNAIDNDVSIQNSKLFYQVKQDEDTPFKLLVSKKSDGTDLLELILEGNLDRETKEIYTILLITIDGGTPRKESVLDVKILVKDKNDNIPLFSQDTYYVTLNDTHKPNKPVVRLSATDLDVGENGKMSYIFSSKTLNKMKQCFKLDEVTGEIFLNEDFHLGKVYELFVEAKDNGKPSMSSTAMVHIIGISHLNNPPNIDVRFILESTGNTAVISEGTHIYSFVAYVKVTDNDSGANGQVKCHLQNRYLQLISVSKKKYKVVVKSEIDRETEKSFNFTIKCQDNGLPPLTVEKQFSMLVTDINDVQPQFSQDIFKFLTYENENKDFPVGYVNATDPDIGDGGQLTYSLLSNGKHILPFQISDVGFISTTESLDREEKNMYEFKVLVKDKGTPSLENTANVVVEVMDLNDNAPYFSVKDSGSPVLSSTTTLSLTLTVSNNTSKIFKTPSKTTMESSNGLQLNVMIVIVIAAVIVSVVIVISISICIVHRLKQTDSNYNNSVDMYHKVTPALNNQSKYIFDPTCVPSGVQYTMERKLKPSQQPLVDREGIYCRNMSADRWNELTLKRPQQIFVPREESMSPGYRELNSSDQFSEMSTLSSHTDSGHGWSVGSAGHYEELPDLCRYQSDHTWNRRNQLQDTLNRSRGDNKYGYHHQPNIDNTSFSNDQIPLSITGTASNTTEQHSTVPVKSQFTSDCKPSLPAVPKITTLPKVPSSPQVPPPPLSATNV